MTSVEFNDSRLPARFWSKVAQNSNTGCWEWQAATTNGYGRYGIGPRAEYKLLTAHRHAYEVLVGPVPDDQFFAFSHLPEVMQAVSRPFGELAQQIVENVPRNPERTVALRKLLEAKDAAVRACIAK